MGFQEDNVEGFNVVRCDDRLDAITAPQLERMFHQIFERDGTQVVILDFTNLESLSSAGIRLLVTFTKHLKSTGGCYIHSIGDEVMEILKMAGFDKILSIFKDEEDLLKQLQK